ncbi:MAG TPA: GIY-YIG nuclease family protein [Thermomicrobiales bacterium]|nr:GIY-YIG nuclease family protein [Thermomicrobiales bacterium]
MAYVYIMANRTRTMYTGVTNDLQRRVWEHKTGFNPDAFTSKYKLTRLVYLAEFARIDDAIAFEKALKGKSRAKKMGIVEQHNPRWNDLAWDWFPDLAASS